jgi:flagellin-specific chaperone FliS
MSSLKHLRSQLRATYAMQMEQAGTPVAEKEFIYTTPVVRGLSYKLLNPKHQGFKKKVISCWDFIEQSIKRANNAEYINTVDLVNKVMQGQSDMWLSVDSNGKTKGCFLVAVAQYPKSVGIFSEATAGKFNFDDMFPKVEQFYKELGYQFVEISGRKGWERVLKPMGYQVKNITIVKRL